ncbi:MAG: CBS domain-containing protein [Opitutales bacterium]|nr:CBS domain-containing protein [Opitutales bacterium]
MKKRFLRISTVDTLRETIEIILHGEEHGYNTAAIAIINQDGNFAGLVTPNQVALGLLGDYESNEASSDPGNFHSNLESRLSITVDAMLSPDQPTVDPESSLATLAKLAGESDFECIPALSKGRVEGLVYTTDIFKEVAAIALNPEDQGIALGED